MKSKFKRDYRVGIKVAVRNRVPLKYQVPVKYAFNWLGGTLEPELKLLELLVNKDDCVIDVGGNRGAYAFKLYRLGANVNVFEPNDLCADILEAWSADKNAVTVIRAALSNTTGSAVLHVPVDEFGIEHDASASLEHADFKAVHDRQVALRTFDSFEFNNVRFIKIDVEGHEHSVIEGAMESIARMKPSLLIEIEQRHISRPISDVFDMVTRFGYIGLFLRAGRLQSISQFNPASDQDFKSSKNAHRSYINNFIFVHPETVNAKFRRAVESAGLAL